MTTIQKVIKYLAIAFAIFLTVSIISAIIGLLAGFAGITSMFNLMDDNKQERLEFSDMNFDNEGISYLDVDIATSHLTIKKGDYLRAETNSKYVTCTRKQ